jgi:RNA polymerase sigma-70 factor (ECF subfamily)
VSTDLELLHAWNGGDKMAGNRLLERYFDRLCRFFRNKIGDEVDDLIQRTFLAATEGRGSFRGDASFRTWIFVVARHELYAYLRRQGRAQATFDPLTHSVLELGTTPSKWLDRESDKRRVLAAMGAQPVEHQILLELYYWEDMSASEIATVLETVEGTVRTRLRRAKQLLADELRKHPAPHAGDDVGPAIRHSGLPAQAAAPGAR